MTNIARRIALSGRSNSLLCLQGAQLTTSERNLVGRFLQGVQPERIPLFVYGINNIESRELAKRTLISLIKLTNKIPCSDIESAMLYLWQIIGETNDERVEYITTFLFGESLLIKLLQSATQLEYKADLSVLLTKLLQKKERAILCQLPHVQLTKIMESAFREYIGPNGKILRGITIVNTPSSGDPSGDVSIVMYAVDGTDNWYGKLRISEYELRSAREWELGFMTQDPSKPTFKGANCKQGFPNTKYPGLPLKATKRLFLGVRELASESHIPRIDVTPPYYHVYHAVRLLGATLDNEHPRYQHDLDMTEYIERQLDHNHIGYTLDQTTKTWKREPGYLRERSWYVYEHRIPSLDNPNRTIGWHMPRMIIRVGGAAN